MKTAGKKNNDTLFSASHDTLEARVFRNNAVPLRIYLLQKIISHLTLILTLISVNTRNFVKTNNKQME